MSLAGAVAKLAGSAVQDEPLKQVTIRSALVYTDDFPRPVSANATTVVQLECHLQRESDRPTELMRMSDGDESVGEARLWVTERALAAVGLTELPIAPPQDEDGQPGAIVNWQGRRWEVIEDKGWDNSFTGRAGFKRYVVADRGAAL